MSTVVDLIKEDHRKVEKLFKEFSNTQDHAIAMKICAELTAHSLLEEEMLYPLLRNEIDKEEAEHAQEEHDEAKKLIARIQATEPGDNELGQMVHKLQEGISHHVQEEESEILPEMEAQVLSELLEMEEAFVQRKKQLVSTIVDAAIVDISEQEAKRTPL